MSKTPGRKNIKGPGKCIFCEGGAVPGNPMTGEHLWSDWMDRANLLPRVSREYIEIASNYRRHTGEKTVAQRYREGSPHYKKIKVVCKQCNSGWMNQIEVAAQPVLTPLIKGTKAVLNRNARKILAEWVVLKMLVAEHSEQQGYVSAPIFLQSDRAAFKRDRTVPPGVRIYLAKHTGDAWIIRYHRRASGLGERGVSLPPPSHPTTRNNVQSTSWGIGKLFIYIHAATDPVIANRVKFVKGPELRKLWPLLSTNFSWPPGYVVSDAFLDDLADSLARFLDRTWETAQNSR